MHNTNSQHKPQNSVQSAEGVEHLACCCSPDSFGDVISRLIHKYNPENQRTIVFTNTKAEASKLAAHPSLRGFKPSNVITIIHNTFQSKEI
jgi:superfamily II DNA/RNA helicase